MKDFPLNDLLAATELDKIRTALQSIFTHLRKIRTTKYPIQRALRLVEAISRDLSGQLLKVSTGLSEGFEKRSNFLSSKIWIILFSKPISKVGFRFDNIAH